MIHSVKRQLPYFSDTCVKLSADQSTINSTFLAIRSQTSKQKEVRHVRRARILYAMDSAANWPVNPWVPQQQCQSTERSTSTESTLQNLNLY